ncbi:sporulation delaying protein family toxin [Staphylococcus haemolyticus]|uniref:sporulation delaying protein family toxin n=1 Tax=Staphylococcus haemolyticus TaxID=1283 RepID=UPI001C1EAA1B|nr:sporulation delaying protein family toxin [Staphylococcus haemolyticus]MBU6949654.1 sporulation delaying protein family toxin [Staphylococcus haemolyticus]MBU7213452.1 sporulation delaying protein family toxin [Staphylococcus haemolyticus]
MKKLFTNVLASTIVLSATTPVVGQTVNAETIQKDKNEDQYTGKELFKGYVFAQGEVGKKLDSKFKSSMVKRLNDEDSKKFVNKTVEQMDQQDPEYFNKLQSAVYEKDPVKVDKLMTKGGKSAEKIINKENSTKENAQVEDRGNWAYKDNYVALETVAAGAVAAVVAVVISQIDATPVAAQDGIDKEEQIDNLINQVND